MPTLDELNNRITVLERNQGNLGTAVTENANRIHNLDTRVDTAENKLKDHELRIQQLRIEVDDHEKRLQLIENSTIEYTVHRDVKYPKKADQGFYLYMPNDLTVDLMMEYNSGVIQQKWNWLNKIFNPQGYGKVSFDLDRDPDQCIKTIVLGQNTRILIPTGIVIENFTPIKSVLKATNEIGNSIHKGLVYGIEVLGQDPEEIIISVFNPTSNTINIAAGDVLVQVLHLFSYHTIPEKQ